MLQEMQSNVSQPLPRPMQPAWPVDVGGEPVRVESGAVSPAEATLDRLSRLGTALMRTPVTVRAGAPDGADAATILHDGEGRTLGHVRLGTGRAGATGDPLADLLGLAADHMLACRSIKWIDHVTLLPNRESYFAGGAGMLRERSLFLVTLADAKHFNEMLRALGQAYADDFIRAGLDRLRSVVGGSRPMWHVSVLSFCFAGDGSHAADEALAQAIATAFAAPIACRDLPITTRAGVGLLEPAGKERPAADALRAVLVAAQESRSRPEGWARYSRATDEAHLRAFRLLTDLRAAVAENRGLDLHFQPRVDLASGRCEGVEALIRWSHPHFGAVSPGEFIPLAEATALIDDVTDWAVDRGLQQVASWRAQGLRLKTALNISPVRLRHPGFVETLDAALSRHGVAPAEIELEFTETAFATHEAQVDTALADISAMGIEIAIDDFGTGYSNLTYLTRLPAKVIKIDQSFVRPLQKEERCRLLVRSITEMAHALGFRVVAEGIETQDAYDMLRGWKCDEGQGYFMSRPLAAGAFEAWLAER
jgi:EAL domain-containing protein (putative c-di-GMP-specific phosphodiesterase class I)/GGDEF domain-containing protein